MSVRARGWLRLLKLAALLICILCPPVASAQERVERRGDPRGSRELIYRDGVLVEELLYGFDSALLEDSFFSSGKLEERLTYQRTEGSLTRVEARDGRGALTGTLRYAYDPSGNLLNVIGDGSFGSAAAGVLGTDVPPMAAWTSAGDQVRAVRYDGEGRPIFTATTKGSAVVETRSDSYGSGPLPTRSVLSETSSGQTRTTDYDEEGRARLLVVSKDSNELSRTEYRYDDSGRLVEERTRTGLDLSSRLLVYDAAGALAREEYRDNGVVNKVVLQPGLDRVEELYDDGVMFVRVSFSGGRPVKEEFFADGVLAWTREYR